MRATVDTLTAYQKSIGAAEKAIAMTTEIRIRANLRMGEELEKLPIAQGRRSDLVPGGNEVDGPPTAAQRFDEGPRKAEEKYLVDDAEITPLKPTKHGLHTLRDREASVRLELEEYREAMAILIRLGGA